MLWPASHWQFDQFFVHVSDAAVSLMIEMCPSVRTFWLIAFDWGHEYLGLPELPIPPPHTHIYLLKLVLNTYYKSLLHKSFKWRKTMSNCESDICKFDLLGLLIKYITHYWILLYNWSIARFRVELEIYGEKNKTFVNAGLMEMLIPAGKTRHWFFKFFFFFY